MFYGDVNSFIVKKDVAYLFLTQGQKTIIDREDLERVLDYRWHAEKDKGTFTLAMVPPENFTVF